MQTGRNVIFSHRAGDRGGLQVLTERSFFPASYQPNKSMLPIVTFGEVKKSEPGFLPAFMLSRPSPSAQRPRTSQDFERTPRRTSRDRVLELRRGWSFGFGAGQMLVKIPKYGFQVSDEGAITFNENDRHGGMEIIQTFLPGSMKGPLHLVGREEFEYHHIHFSFKDPACYYYVMEIVHGATSPTAQLRLLSGRPPGVVPDTGMPGWKRNAMVGHQPLHEWLTFDSSSFPLAVTKEQRKIIADFTGVFLKLKEEKKAKLRQAPKPIHRSKELDYQERREYGGHWKQHRVLDYAEVSPMLIKQQLGL